MQQTPQPAQTPRAPAQPRPAQEAATPATAQQIISQINNDAALQALHFKRGEINDQIKALTARRNELNSQRQSLSVDAGRAHDERIRLLDDRAAQLERQLLQVDEQIERAISNVGGQEVAGGGSGRAGRSDVVGVAQRDELIDEVRRAASNGGEDAALGALAGTGTFLFFAFLIYQGVRRWIWKRKPAASVPSSFDAQQLAQLQRSMDVVAVEVERIAEAQRYVAKLLNERSLGAGDAQPLQSRGSVNADPVERR